MKKAEQRKKRRKEMLKEIKTIGDLNGVINNESLKDIKFEDLLPQTTIYSVGSSDEVEVTEKVYFDEDTNELVRPRYVLARGDDMTFFMKEVWNDECWETRGVITWHYGMPDGTEVEYLPIKKELTQANKAVRRILAERLVKLELDSDGWGFLVEYGDANEENVEKAINDTIKGLDRPYAIIEWLKNIINDDEDGEYSNAKDLMEEVGRLYYNGEDKQDFLLMDSQDNEPYNLIHSLPMRTQEEMQTIIRKLCDDYDTRDEQGYGGSDNYYEYLIWRLEQRPDIVVFDLWDGKDWYNKLPIVYFADDICYLENHQHNIKG